MLLKPKSQLKLINKRQVIKLDTKRIKACLEYFGNPQETFRSVIIGGTNGKGSVTFYLSNLANKLTKLKIGRYTSPHLTSWYERYVINEEIPQFKIQRILKDTIRKIKEFEKINPQYGPLTVFEIYTIISFLLFKEEKVDIALLEVGMGGRLDATNVVSSKNTICSVITNISLEHTQYLGETIEKIAFEKGGIIKENNHVITSAENEALKIINNIANENHSRLIHVDTNKIKSYKEKNIEIALKVWEFISVELNIKEQNINKKEFLRRLEFPGRFQLIKEYNLLLDGAHNPAGAKELRNLLEMNFNNKRIIYIIGILDKDYKSFIDNLSLENNNVICTEPKSPRSTKKEELESYVKEKGSSAETANNLKEAINKAFNKEHNIIVITGSLYLVGEALELLRNKRVDLPLPSYNLISQSK